jgi:hypothetical protein
MNRYEITIKFREGKDLDFTIDSDEDVRQQIADEHNNAHSVTMYLGDYSITKDEILWIKVKGETLEKPGREVQDNREKKQ